MTQAQALQIAREALERMAKYPGTRADEMSAGSMRQFAREALAALATVSDAPPSPVSVQPASEQAARFAIDGAITFGRMGVNKPPSDDHWLMPFWLIGGECAKAASPAPDVRPSA